MTESQTLTLTDIARRLDQPQHRLIHLCETGVVEPDHQDARGRGSSRLFSPRNLLEFAVALRLRTMNQPLAVARVVIHVLRRFESEVRKQVAGFALPQGLRCDSAPDLRLVISDGQSAFFVLALKGYKPKVFGGVPLEGSPSRARGLKSMSRKTDGGFGEPEGSRYARLELSITRVAQDLPLD